jgi:hypothetical protein
MPLKANDRNIRLEIAKAEFRIAWKNSVVPRLAEFSSDLNSLRLLRIKNLCWIAFKSGKGLDT